MTAERFRLFVGWVIVLAWLCALILDAAVPRYDVPISLSTALLLVAGWLFGPAIAGRTRRGGKGYDDDLEP